MDYQMGGATYIAMIQVHAQYHNYVWSPQPRSQSHAQILAFRRLQSCKRQKAGRGTGNEATITRYWSSYAIFCCTEVWAVISDNYLPQIMTADSARTGTSWPVLVNKCGMHVEMVDGLEYIVYYFTIHNLEKIILAEMLQSIFIPD